MSVYLVAELEENYRRFIERALKSGCVWALECEESFLCCPAHNCEWLILPFWSDAAYARRALKEGTPTDT